MSQLREMPQLVFTTVIVGDNVTRKFNLDRILNVVVGWSRIQVLQLSNQFGALFDQLAFWFVE